MLHTVFQACLASRCWNDQWLDEKIDEVIRENLVDLVRINVNVETAVREVKARAKGVQTFFDRYMSEQPKVCFLWPFLSVLIANFCLLSSMKPPSTTAVLLEMRSHSYQYPSYST